jgi:hypothetical protein
VTYAAVVTFVAFASCLQAVSLGPQPAAALERPNTPRAKDGPSGPPAFGRVVVVVFENKAVHQVLGSPAAPTFNRLARRFAVLTSYFAVAHPSLPNYLALVSGSTGGITTNCTRCVVRAPSLADSLSWAGKSWKTYAEGLPAPGFTGAGAGRYAKKHNPFLYFPSVLRRPARRRRVVPLSRLPVDLRQRRLPAFSLIVPDLCHDMHDCPVSTGDAWLRRMVGLLLKSPQMRAGVIFVVFDEGPASDHAGGGGHVPALVLGPLVRRGSRAARRLDHYSLLRTIEDGWRLPRLGRSATARPIAGIWRRAPPRHSRAMPASRSAAASLSRPRGRRHDAQAAAPIA